MLIFHPIVVLTGEEGCGKTTAAQIYANFHRDHKDVSWISSADFLNIKQSAGQRLFVIDDFLGRTSVDSVNKWKDALLFLSRLFQNSDRSTFFLLVMRKSILENAMQSFGADLALVVRKFNTVALSLKPQETFNSLVTVQMTPPDFNLTPDVGFPLCCSLVSHLPQHLRPDFFHSPRQTLLALFRQWFQTDSVAKTACSHLAFTEAYVSKVLLLDSFNVGFLGYAPQTISIQRQLQEQMVAFYHNNPGFILVEEDFVSFRNEAVREAVLTALCETDADLVAHNCSLTLLSQLAMVTSDELNSEDFPKRPPLPEKATTAFVRRMIEEMDSGNYRDTLTSHLLSHETFCSEFLRELEDSRLQRLLQRYDTDGLPFLFWSGACERVFSRLLEHLKTPDVSTIVQALLACCFWGHAKSIQKLYHKLPIGVKESLQKLTLQQLLSQYLQESPSKPELLEGNLPFYADDTLLTLAAWRGHEDVVKCLLEQGFPINTRGHHNTTSLMHFTCRGNVEMTEHLLSKDADPCLKDDFHMTALHYAMCPNEWAVPDGLFHENNINERDAFGFTPLEAACAAGWSVTSIQRLLDNGACSYSHSAALKWACFHKMGPVVSLLTEKTDTNYSKQALIYLTACLMGLEREDLLQQILKIQSIRNVPKPKSERALVTAAGWSSEEVVETLLRAYPPSQAVLNTALYVACHSGNVSVIKLLHRENAQVFFDEKDKSYSCLSIACVKGHMKCVETLLSLPNVKISEQHGIGALGEAIIHRHLAIARLLFDRFLFKNQDLGPLLHKGVEANSPVVLDWCMKERPGDINATDHIKMTAFALACLLGNGSAAMWLADHGADLTVKDSYGSTYLHLAALTNRQDLVTALLNMDPPLDRNVRDKDGYSPLQVAIREGHISCEQDPKV